MKIEENSYYVMRQIIGCSTQGDMSMASNANLTLEEFYEAIDYIDKEKLMRIMIDKDDNGRITHTYFHRYSITPKGQLFMDRIKSNIEAETMKRDTETLPAIFLSYNQKSGNDLADKIEKEMQGKAIIRRDKKDVDVWDSITNFMNSIREQDFAILVISDEYLKSGACLYEVVQLMKEKNWKEKALFVVLKNAQIYNAYSRGEYIRYWANESTKLDNMIKSLPSATTSELSKTLKESITIQNAMGEFLEQVASVNNPPVENAIEGILKKIRERTVQDGKK